MSKARILLILGTWVAILPYLGFPSFWKNILFTLSGLVLTYFSYILYKNSKVGEHKKPFDNFIENDNFKEDTLDSQESTEETNK
ncbi:MAG: hypothetical protein WC609_02965 [Candidatus Paceibacterota bacterium]|jgi:hypothetical protein